MPPTLKPPLAASDLPPEWYSAIRQAMSVHEGVPLRANPHQPSIDVWSVNRRTFMPLQLPGDGVLFVDFDARNAVLKKIQEGK